jgi:PKD repeat protein
MVATIALATPFAAYAAFSFSEIMFDAAGTDTKHEWVEVYNDGDATDLSTFKFYENGSNHGLTLHSGSATISANGYAIIADDAATFLIDFPSYTGPLFDASFSLSNMGETVSLRSTDLVDVATANYTADSGALGDGNSIHFINGSWVSRSPSPGSVAPSGSQPPAPTTQTGQNTSSSVFSESEAPKITVDAGPDKTVVVGAGAVFSATAYGLKQEPLTSARYVWNLGNAVTKEGKSILYAYTIPGTYIVTVDASNAGVSATDRVQVTVVPADIVVTRANQDYIEIENRTSYELDLGLWQVRVGTQLFVLPSHSLVRGKGTIILQNDATGLAPSAAREVVLLYPNGVLAGGPAPEILFTGESVAQKVETQTQLTPKIVSEPAPPLIKTAEQNEELLAATVTAESNNSMYPWIFGVGIVVVIGVGTVLFLRRGTSAP